MQDLLKDISKCMVCDEFLSNGARPVLAAHEKSKILLIGQAPGIAVHRSGITWDDKSGDNLRGWLNIGKDIFYNPELIAQIPMGFCYPGKGKSGDLPPRKECAPLWHKQLLDKMPNIELTILIGKYAQDAYLENSKRTLTENVLHFEHFLPDFFVLPHPSPRNNIWQATNDWFKKDVIPALQIKIQSILES